MTTAEAAPTTSAAGGPARAAGPRWQPLALTAVVALSLVLYGWNLDSLGWGNAFYSAAVKSMSQSPTDLVFGSFDPAGVVTVDKPPMAFWPQVLSAAVFGYHGWALLLPQAVEGGAAVFLLHRTVRRWAGENVALLAALVLALTPITVAINRDNNPDSLLTLLCVAAAYAFTRATEPGARYRSTTLWLLQAAFWLGCGFLTKMLAGWMTVPALVLGYLVASRAGWGRRVADLAGSAVVLLATSLSWVAVTEVWPGRKPYIGGSTDGSALDLIIGYNGLGRVFGQKNMPAGHGGPGHGGPGHGGPGHAGPGHGGPFGGQAGLGRLFGEQVGGQISWLLPFALLTLVVAAAAGVRAWRAGRLADPFARGQWVLWGSWLVVLGAVFSVQEGIFHSYYTTQMAPALAVLVAVGFARAWQLHHSGGRWTWALLPAGIAITAVWAWVVVSRDTSWNGWLRYAVVALAAVAVVGLVLARTGVLSRAARPALLLGVVASLLAPGTWALAKPFAGAEAVGGAMPSAGPPGSAFGSRHQMPTPPGMSPAAAQGVAKTGRLPGGVRPGGGELAPEQAKIRDYALGHAGGARVPLSVEGGAMATSPYIINSPDVTNTQGAIIGMGGFMGSDDAPNPDQLARWKADGSLGFVLSQAPGPAGQPKPGGHHMSSPAAQARIAWVQHNCAPVPASAYGGTGRGTSPVQQMMGGGAQALYSCHM